MPIVSPSFAQSIADALDEVLDSLKKALGDVTESLDPHHMLAQMQPLFEDLGQLLADFTPMPPDQAFLVPDGVTPGADQVGYDEFSRLVLEATAAQWTSDLKAAYGPIDTTVVGGAGGAAPAGAVPGAGPGLGGAANVAGPVLPGASTPTLGGFLKTIAPFCDPEQWLRYALNLKRVSTDPLTVAQEIASAVPEAVAAAIASMNAGWGDDEPMDDETKKVEEPNVGIPTGTPLASWIDNMVSAFPGATGPKGPRVGRDVHRAIMAKYVLDHPGRVVVVDGVIRLESLTSVSVQLSRLLTPDGLSSIDPDPQLQAFAAVMRDPANNKRIHPDIADMSLLPATIDDTGWFEIKPMGDIRLAYNEIMFYYLPTWNEAVLPVPEQAAWKKSPGAWQPVMISVTPRYSYAFAAVTMPPGGAIGYLTFELAAAAKAAEAVIITTLAAMFMKRMLKDLRQIGQTGLAAVAAVVEFVFAWAALLVLVVAAVLFAIEILAEGAIAGIGTAIAGLVARLGPLMEEIIASGLVVAGP